MLTEIYIEAVDEELADEVWEAWDCAEIDSARVFIAWMLVAWSSIKLSRDANDLRGHKITTQEFRYPCTIPANRFAASRSARRADNQGG